MDAETFARRAARLTDAERDALASQIQATLDARPPPPPPPTAQEIGQAYAALTVPNKRLVAGFMAKLR